MFQQQSKRIRQMAGFGAVVTAAVNNITRIGADANFYVGDSYLVSLVGAPNTTVWVNWQHDSKSGMGQMGVTDPSGNFVLTGKMTADTVGTWTETWMVGSQSATPVVFTVTQPPSGVTTSTTSTTATTTTSAVTNPLSSLLALQLFGFPAWLVVGGGFVAMKMFGGRR